MSDNSEKAGQECEYLNNCVVWPRFHTDSKFVWIKTYCQGPKKDECARKKQKTQKAFIPDELLPNGAYLNPEGSASHECENLKNCAVWKKFNTNSKMIWIKAYCQGPNKDSCARKLRSAKGENVPESLLPNGDML